MEAGATGGSSFDHIVGDFQELRNRKRLTNTNILTSLIRNPAPGLCQDRGLHLEGRSSKMCCVI